MKKTYIEPTAQIYRIRTVQMIAESFNILDNKTDSGEDLDGSNEGGQDNGAWSRSNNGSSVWDNAW